MNDVSLHDYQMGRNRIYPQEWTPEVENNAIELLKRVNAFLKDLVTAVPALDKEMKVSSGWRPAAINANIANAAKKSAHMTGEAVDLLDINQSIAKEIVKYPELLAKHDLYLENPNSTKGWVHLQTRRTKSGNRIFNP